MAKIKISELDAAAALDGTEEIPVVQGGETVKATAQDIADLGGLLTVVTKDDDFTVDGASGTVYVNIDVGEDITATLEDSPVGTQYTFVKEFTDGGNLRVVPAASNFIVFWSDKATANQIVPGDGDWVEGGQDFATFTILKISATHWTVISDNGGAFAND